jgi:hypothetical protein
MTMCGSLNPGRVKNFLYNVLTGSRVHPVSYAMVAEGYGKVGLSLLNSAEVKKTWICTVHPI